MVRSAGAAGPSLVPDAAVSATKATRSGVAKSEGDWWSRWLVTLSMVALCRALRGRRELALVSTDWLGRFCLTGLRFVKDVGSK